MKIVRCLAMVTLISLLLPVWAGEADASKMINASLRSGASGTGSASGLQWNGWGVRAGWADDADQFIGGAHFNLGEIARNLRFQPDVQLGAGDDVTTLYGTAPLYYRFSGSGFTPYAGGGVALGWVDVDLPANSSGDDSSFEMGAKLTGGLEWPREGGQSLSVELSLGFGDVHDLLVVAGWTF